MGKVPQLKNPPFQPKEDERDIQQEMSIANGMYKEEADQKKRYWMKLMAPLISRNKDIREKANENENKKASIP